MFRSHLVAVALILGAGSIVVAQGATKGEKVFLEQKCALCHSIAGKGNAKGPLDAVGSTSTAEDARAWLTDAKAMTAKTKAARKPEMKAYTLPKEDVDALVDYLMTLKKSK
jgi:mono/diheme cytochrome c family protein